MRKASFKSVCFILLMSIFFANNLCTVKASCSQKTVKNLLKIALMPVGKTLYIYGGGWNQEDNGAGRPAKTIGLYDDWQKFYDSQNHNYDFDVYDYLKDKSVIYNGLDCTGYMGWVLYNFLEEQSETDLNQKDGYIFKSASMAQKLSDKGFGEVTLCDQVCNDMDFRPGDIMASRTQYHVYMVLGKCSDGSILFVHSSPPGVSICGTVNKDNSLESEAIKLADKYMSKYYPDYQKKFPKRSKPMIYLTEFDRFRFSDEIISDNDDGYLNMPVENMMDDLFAELFG